MRWWWWLALAGCGGPDDTAGGGDLRCALRADTPLVADCALSLRAAADVELVVEDDHGEVRRYASDAALTHAVAVWGLPADTALTVRVEGAEADAVELVTPPVLGDGAPPPLDRLVLRAATRPGEPVDGPPVLIDVMCEDDLTTAMLVAVDRRGRVVWLADPEGPVRGLALTAADEVSAIVANDRVVTWNLAGERGAEDRSPGCDGGAGPCPHHALGVDDGVGWHATGQVDATSYPPWGLVGCEDKAAFAIDGVAWDDGRSFTLPDVGIAPDTALPDMFNPAGPNPECASAYWAGTLGTDEAPIDHAHLNGVAVDGDLALLSLHAFHELALVDVAAGALRWRLHAEDTARSDFPVPLKVAAGVVDHRAPRFEGQHDPRWLPDGRVQLYDNLGDADASRVLRLDLSGPDVVIDEVYTFVDDDDGTWSAPAPRTCTTKGGATTPDSGHPVVSCRSGFVMELDRPDGTTADGPRWFLHASCGDDVEARGFYRPVALP